MQLLKKTALFSLLAVSLGAQLPTPAMAASDLGLVTGLSLFGTTPALGAFDDLYNFTVAQNSGAIISGTAFIFGTGGTTMTIMELYAGTFASASDLLGKIALPTTTVLSQSTGMVFTAFTKLSDYSYSSLSAPGYTLRVAGTSNGWTLPYTGYIALAPVPAVPEPETYALVLAGLGMMGAIIRRRKIG